MKHLIKNFLTIIFLSLTLPSTAQYAYKVVIDYQFNEPRSFANGLAAVKKGGKWGFIDQTGKVVIDYQFDDATYFYSNGLACVYKGEKWGYIDKTGETVIDFQFDETWGFNENGLAAAKKGGKWGYIDKTGKAVIDFQFDETWGFNESGLAIAKKSGKWGFIDQTGEVVISYQYYEANNFASNGLAAIKKTGKWGYIDRTGKVVIDYQFDNIRSFANGLATVKKAGKWGYINQTGQVVIDYQFDNASFFTSNGLAAVKNGGKWGFIDQTGKVVIDYLFDETGIFAENGLAAVKNGGKWGFIDQTGKVVIDYLFAVTGTFAENGLAFVFYEGKWGYIKKPSPSNDITEYINTEIIKWQEKGKYEPSEDYKLRVCETNRKKKLEELSNIAVQFIAPNFCDWKNITTEYDADNQTSKVNVSGLLPFYLKVPLSEAESFDKSISAIQFQNVQYALNSDGNFFLQNAIINNPSNGKVYNFSSADKAVFAYTQLNMNFEPLNINLQTVDNPNSVRIDTKTVSVGMSEVDVNIPTNPQTNDKTFVVIIANENYTREVKVQFAANDGKVFKEYCEKTLGIPSKNIHFSTDATFGTMKSEIKWISDVAQAFDGQAKLVFYYAGHGMPNESNKSAYLLPVDGFSSDYETAIKLDDLYNRLNQNPTQSVTVLLDACFSGSIRDNGMLANARGVKIRPKVDALKGNLVVFSAATGDETAYPFKEKQHGLFTFFLLKKLQETKGNVDYQNLSNYIIEQVKQQSIVVNQKSQTPQVITSIDIQNTWQILKMK